MVGIILKNFFISSQQTIQLPPSNAHRLYAPKVANERSLCYFGDTQRRLSLFTTVWTILSFSHLASNWVAPPNSVYKISQANVSGLYIRTVVP